MGYIKTMYGTRSREFIEGFLAAMDTYAVWYSGNRCIGPLEKSLKREMIEAVKELSNSEEEHTIVIEMTKKYF